MSLYVLFSSFTALFVLYPSIVTLLRGLTQSKDASIDYKFVRCCLFEWKPLRVNAQTVCAYEVSLPYSSISSLNILVILLIVIFPIVSHYEPGCHAHFVPLSEGKCQQRLIIPLITYFISMYLENSFLSSFHNMFHALFEKL